MLELSLAFLKTKSKLDLAIQSGPYNNNCQILATNDLLAVSTWYSQFQGATLESYQRVGQRLLLWCTYIKGLSLAKLIKENFEEYLGFLQQPPKSWCLANAYRGAKKHSASWRPFVAGLSGAAFKIEVRIINSLMNYLVQADYLRTNPLKLIRISSFSLDLAEHKYSVLTRMLEPDEWDLVQEAINELPEVTELEIANKLRIQVLFALLYLLGLRINEVASHTWAALQKKNNVWWFFVKGKGGKLGQVPVNNQLMQIIQTYRLQLGKSCYPELNENEPIFISRKTKQALSTHQLYNLVKVIGTQAAAKTSDTNKQQKLAKLSPHWLRHLSASHQDKAGIPAKAIQANHRHSSFATTQIYLHAEDELRANEMEKMQINFASIKSSAKEIKPVSLAVYLKGNNVIGIDGIEFMLKFISKNILSSYTWQQDLIDAEALTNYSQSVNKELNLLYTLMNINNAQLDLIIKQIKMAAEIRLLQCKISIKDSGRITARQLLEEKNDLKSASLRF